MIPDSFGTFFRFAGVIVDRIGPAEVGIAVSRADAAHHDCDTRQEQRWQSPERDRDTSMAARDSPAGRMVFEQKYAPRHVHGLDVSGHVSSVNSRPRGTGLINGDDDGTNVRIRSQSRRIVIQRQSHMACSHIRIRY